MTTKTICTIYLGLVYPNNQGTTGLIFIVFVRRWLRIHVVYMSLNWAKTYNLERLVSVCCVFRFRVLFLV